VEVKPMLGQFAAFVNSNIFAGLFGADFGVKLEEGAAAELAAVPGSGPFGPAERPMGGCHTLPADLSDAEAAAWMDRAASTSPPWRRSRGGDQR
jgi:hypothetical protein